VFDSIDEWLRGLWLDFTSLARTDQAILVAELLVGLCSLVGVIATAQELFTDFRALATSLPIGRFVQNHWEVILGFTLTAILFLVQGKTTRRSVLGAYKTVPFEAAPMLVPIKETILLDIESDAIAQGGRIERIGQFAAWTDPRLNRAILHSKTDIAIELRDGDWLAYRELFTADPDRSRDLRRYVVRRALARGGRVFNAAKVRLAGDLLDGGKLVNRVPVQKTDYVSSLMTDGTAFQQIQATGKTGRAGLTDGLEFFVEELVGKRHRLLPLARTRSSNQAGASILVLTSDWHLVGVVQSDRAAYSQGLVAPSGSGSLDWDDLFEGGELRPGILAAACAGAEREFREESATHALMDREVRARAYAFTRLLHRGGKPEFFVLGTIAATFDEVQRCRTTRQERVYSERQVSAFGVALDPATLRDDLMALQRRLASGEFLREARGDAQVVASLSYQLSHAVALLAAAAEDDADWAVLAEFLRVAADPG
jgi:hypothetical protein